jgi:hypothetical protein
VGQFESRMFEMPKPMPSTDEERTVEAQSLLARLLPEESKLLTTWEFQLVEELKAGKAATKIRLKELRDVVKRIEHARQ